MKKLFISVTLFISIFSFGIMYTPQIASAASCSKSGSFFGLPTWYKYLHAETSTTAVAGKEDCDIKINNVTDIWLIAAAIVEALIRVAALLAVAFIIYGGVSYIISQSEPEKTAQALHTVINAVIGLVIAIVSSSVVSFVAGRFN